MKVLTVIGARPQFIKASVVSKALVECDGVSELLVHTGQHFDSNMSDIFFDQLLIPRPEYLLDIHGGSHGEMTGRMLCEIEQVMLKERPNLVLVYGDTNSTLAGALAAVKLHIPVAHVEAGLRSFNMRMPEEINRILTDQVSDVLFCPTNAALDNLAKEGFLNKPVQVLNVGDVMQDSALFFAQRATAPKGIDLSDRFFLATLHRAENTDDPARLTEIVSALNTIHATIAPVVLPLHPRTKAVIDKANLALTVNVVDPLGYLEMIWLLQRCDLVLTDSGGVQKEAFFFGKPCVTMRDQTEWVELVEAGANELVGAVADNIVAAAHKNRGRVVQDQQKLYGGGEAATRIAEHLSKRY
ncbi:non-hydrolyzing UDP-N-acetylglucosamine 2-epimerase [Stutzerimonas stutzeri]|uniref:UDP-N-acetylglucosamine 2-epimerase n=1 Tax=Stutzerimonas stutzeri TaxID=316 RepID=A0A172WTI9_STUST|nr:UDP-N-acetylglucosamine 2-epimerase (non-hydrolyzing) [Stutzerimonas stutzeri]ANF26722.1 UDP-N-acetylglucosamine 2-epimerase [Stutzerimonas stutzeri]